MTWTKEAQSAVGQAQRAANWTSVITLVAGRPELVEEVQAEPIELRRWIGDELSKILDDPEFRYAVEGALPDAREVSGFYDVIIGSFRRLMPPA